MQENPVGTHRKLYFVIFLISSSTLMLFFYDNTLFADGFSYNRDEVRNFEESEFLVYSSKCRIVNLDPFNDDAKKFFRPEKYKACRSLKLLTFIAKPDNETATLHIDNDISPSYSTKGVSCCYSNVTRKIDKNHPDKAITISPCKTFENNVTIYNDPVKVRCTEFNITGKKLYENVHVATVINDEVKKKLEIFDNTKRLSVLLIGIDSISQLSFMRALPKTLKFVEERGWIPLKGYNKIDDNTFPNLMAILTGYNRTQSYEICDPTAKGKLDKCDLVWYEYRKRGYVTAFGEDEASINTFNYFKEGFTTPPADYYYRPYVLATEELVKTSKDSMTYCTGPETAGERIMNLAKDFAVTFISVPSFGFFWMNSFSHNKLNSPTGMDAKVKDFLEDLTSTGVTESSMVIFFSDHGLRFGDIRLTDTGWLEERLPFVYVSFPSWFQQQHSKEYDNFKSNTNKLTTPYDLYMTLQHVLALSGVNYTVKTSPACPGCRSLFEEIADERSCEDAGIAQHWCTCAGYKSTPLAPAVTNKISSYLVEALHNTIRSRKHDHKCAKYSIDKILGASVSQQLAYKKERYLLLKFRTYPKAVFEVTLSYSGDINYANFSHSGGISRMDSYETHSRCVNDPYLKNYCYCRSKGERV